MAFYSNIAKALRSNKFLQNQGDKLQRKVYVAPIRFHRTLMRSFSSLENPKRVVKAVLILSYEPQRQRRIYESDLLAKDTEHESFFDAILIAARIFVIGSVVTGLAIAYFITRFTQGYVFPIILRKSN